jgi:hypothetical protein
MNNMNTVEIKTELAQMASELRILGFNEDAIKRVISSITNEVALDAMWDMVARYKNAQDLYGDAQE